MPIKYRAFIAFRDFGSKQAYSKNRENWISKNGHAIDDL